MDFMHVKLWLLLYCCLVVIGRNAEVPIDSLRFKTRLGHCVERALPGCAASERGAHIDAQMAHRKI